MKQDQHSTAGNERGNRPAEWGSDAMAGVIRDLGIPYMTLNPGASFRGLHDSIVNYLGNATPRLLLCIHEEAAVSIAHGYAKVTGRPLAVGLHSNVGLMHGAMGIFNAWCDRVPMLVIGATGPFDAARRRPWIDGLHTAQDQGALIRDFTKWDDQPHGVTAARWSLLEGYRRTASHPCAPVYVNLDAELQESRLEAAPPPIDAARFLPVPPPAPDADALQAAARALAGARAPVILIGRVGRDRAAWDRRVALAERLGARVLTDFKTGATFPNRHPLHAAPEGYFVGAEGLACLRAADVVLALDWVDLGGTLRAAFGGDDITARVINAQADDQLQRGWGKEAGTPPPADIALSCPADSAVAALLTALGAGAQPAQPGMPAPPAAPAQPVTPADTDAMTAQSLATLLRAGLAGRTVSLLRAPLSWTGADWPMADPLDFLGYDGGGGVGSGPGMAVGAALALRDHHPDRLPLAVLGDGDFLMNASAIWTAAHADVPLLIVVANNRSFYNDEIHQEKVALQRDRPVENKHVGLATDNPDIDIAAIATGHGAQGIGPVTDAGAFRAALARGVDAVEKGAVVVIDARIAKGYAPAMDSAMRG
ncbi:MAG: thiamine pyrophosphate-binding protein [Pararhodobacter sp.]